MTEQIKYSPTPKGSRFENWLESLVNALNAWMTATATPKCVLQKDANTNVETATWTAVTWGVEVYDVPGWHSTVADSQRITVDVAGTHLIHVHITWNTYPVTSGLRIVKNAAATVIGQCNSSPSITTVVELAANDYVVAQAYQASGGTLVIDGSVAVRNEFSVVRLSTTGN